MRLSGLWLAPAALVLWGAIASNAGAVALGIGLAAGVSLSGSV